MKQSLLDIGNSFFENDDVKQFITNNPYMGFVLMSAMIEFLGKCSLQQKTFSDSAHSEEDFLRAIKDILPLQKYKKWNIKIKLKKGKNKTTEKTTNKLYSALRCGMLHSLLPKEGILLAPKSTELDKNIVGAVDLYNDLKDAWSELLQRKPVDVFLETTPSIVVENGVSGTCINQENVNL
ncbi:MAG: hypothetical protein K5778_00700 [Bacteroidaceae bacterium]|nr:hypothetical protein [Bacteroidaceae bacterium]